MDIETEEEKLDQFHWHEALDRTDMIRNIIEDNLSSHPVIKQHLKLKAILDKVQDMLGDLYSEISNTEQE